YGAGWVDDDLPFLNQLGSTTVAVVTGGTDYRYYDTDGLGTWMARHYLQDKLTADGAAKQFVLTTAAGDVLRFEDFSASWPALQQGTFVSYTDAAGNTLSVTSRTTDGKPAEVRWSTTSGGTTYTESFLYTYIASGVNAGMVSNTTLRRQVN